MMINRSDSWEPLLHFLREERTRAVLLAAVPALFVVILAYLGGIGSFGSLFLIGLIVFIILAGTFLSLPREEKDVIQTYSYQSSSDREYSLNLSRLGVELFDKPSKRSVVEWFDPDIDAEELFNAMVYLNNNGYIVDDGFRSVLPDKQGKQLRVYMLDKGFAYETDELYKGGWQLNAAGRSVVKRYLTQALIEEDFGDMYGE